MEVKKLTKIGLCCENVELFTIAAEDVATYYLSKVTEAYGKGWYDEVSHTTKIAKKATIVLRASADCPLIHSENGKTLFERLTQFRDLVSITMYYEDDSEDEVYFRWCDGNDYCNNYQTTAKLNDGSLIITISKNKTASQIATEIYHE